MYLSEKNSLCCKFLGKCWSPGAREDSGRLGTRNHVTCDNLRLWRIHRLKGDKKGSIATDVIECPWTFQSVADKRRGPFIPPGSIYELSWITDRGRLGLVWKGPQGPGFTTKALGHPGAPWGGDLATESSGIAIVSRTLPIHEFHETCHSVTFIVLVNSHQRWKQTRNRVCFHLWCELTLALWCHSIVWSLFFH